MRGRAGRHFFAVACALLLAALGLPPLASVDVAAASSTVATVDRTVDDPLALLRQDGTAADGSADDSPPLAASPALQDSCGFGSVVQLEGTSHLWVLERDRRLHWAGDTRALDGRALPPWGCGAAMGASAGQAPPAPWTGRRSPGPAGSPAPCVSSASPPTATRGSRPAS